MCQQLIKEWNGNYSSIVYISGVSAALCVCRLHCPGKDGADVSMFSPRDTASSKTTFCVAFLYHCVSDVKSV